MNSNQVAVSQLWIGMNHAGIRTCNELSHFLAEASKLIHLSLKKSQIDFMGASILMNGAKESRTLRSLDISWNDIGLKAEPEFGTQLGEASKLCPI